MRISLFIMEFIVELIAKVLFGLTAELQGKKDSGGLQAIKNPHKAGFFEFV